MPVLCEDPKLIHDAYKEAVVDSLLNNLSARLAGKGEFYRVIYGMKPAAALMTGFIVPMPKRERNGDEEADPIRISAHGLDFQVKRQAAGDKFSVSVTGAVYVRILPTEDEINPGGRLEPVFPLNSETRKNLKAKIRESLKKLAESLSGGRSNAEWPAKSQEARRQAHADFHLPFDNALDRSSDESSEQDSEQIEEGENEEEGNETLPELAVAGASQIPDALAEPISAPAKWFRLDLILPDFEFTPSTALEDAKAASDTLNGAIATQLEAWAKSDVEPYGGKLWGYRRGRPIRPSDASNWKRYLETVRKSSLAPVVPKFELRWDIQAVEDPIDASRLTLHVALENWTPELSSSTSKEIEPSLFQLSVSVKVPSHVHKSLRLDRVKPSYRYDDYLRYPALGFNGSVTIVEEDEVHCLSTNWSPRYVLPRLTPTKHPVLLNISDLAEPDSLDGVRSLVSSYEEWLEQVRAQPICVDNEDPNAPQNLINERIKFEHDWTAWNDELNAIRCGINILEKSRSHWSGPGPQTSSLGIPFEAWTSMNAAMSKVAAAKGYTDWRLFQLAFILASIPAFVTRIPAFEDFYTPEVAKYSDSVTLLYFATGGGKSEAFLGLLAFVLFLDRLRGKSCGVSALMRYPLRLLTLQQAQRTFIVMSAAEEVRFSRKHPGEPFSLGFWVGGSNTPNWHADDAYTDVPLTADVPPSEESIYQDARYTSARERWLKLAVCPFCGSKGGRKLALRRWSGSGGHALGHFCTADASDCTWNSRFTSPTPLPFYIVDQDIYALAPSVLLGTVDKLSALGQSQGTIRKFFGMFGLAPFEEIKTGRLYTPARSKDWKDLPGTTMRTLFPVYPGGEKNFFDPFPALLIQDEAHLLDESLGTFAGLFESALEAGFDQLAVLLRKAVICAPGTDKRRKIKVIAASATVSEPERQMRNLYQREGTIQFPYPGPELYRSFYAAPKQPDSSSDDLERAAMPESDVELRSRWARVYASILTNGHRHTVAVASVLGHYHLLITRMYEQLRSEDATQIQAARDELVRWVSSGPYHKQFGRLLAKAEVQTLLTLVDLHRIALTYVTNKKGGDQVIDTEKVQFEKLHQADGLERFHLTSELISGAVSAAQIQDIVRRAETRASEGKSFPELNDTLRSIIATSAISHGVDVEEFNAMFFAGIPSDIAEYIQASSRVGRTHVGFSLLIPVPQRHRDRFVFEIHDIFHRFLERMILPASVDRWAEKALTRVMPSFFQEFVCGIRAIELLCAAPADAKQRSQSFAMAPDVQTYLASNANLLATQAFMQRALGLDTGSPPEGRDHYIALLKDQLNRYRNDLDEPRLILENPIGKFFKQRDPRLRPMTSLRDVDQAGIIHESRLDARFKRVNDGVTSRAMAFIRRGSGADLDATDLDSEANTYGESK